MASDVEIVRSWYPSERRLWDAGRLDWMYEHAWDPDVDWRAIPGAPDDVGPIVGRDRLRRYYAEWLELFDEVALEAVEVEDVGGHVVATLRASARSRTSGAETSLTYSIALTLRDGRAARGREFATRAEALAEARAAAAR